MKSTTEHDWTDDFHLENGNYLNSCLNCKTTFTGHKRRMICRACAKELDLLSFETGQLSPSSSQQNRHSGQT